MKFDGLPKEVRIFGNIKFRGPCPNESLEQATFFNELRTKYPASFGRIAIHPRNEQQLIGGQFRGIIKQKAEGMVSGAADIIIPGAPTFVCELKRQDHTKSQWQEGQIEYLGACAATGAFTCVALGHEAAMTAVERWLATARC